jgi:fimbrial isopeptide formation D2 family protein/LPXTG-motif cell wall-anchored protein
MKTLKKISALILALAMCFALAMPAFATEGDDADNSGSSSSQTEPEVADGSIVIKSAVKGQTYTAYKLFKAQKGTDGAITYYVDAVAGANPLVSLVGHGVTFTKSADSSRYTVDQDSFDADTLAAHINANLEEVVALLPVDGTETHSVTATGSTAEITGLDAGYYYIDSSLGALCALGSEKTRYIYEKNTEPSIEKKVDAGQSDSKSIGDSIDFTITVTAGGKADTSYIVHDTATGLAVDASSFEITVGDAAVDEENYDVTTSNLTDGCSFEIEFKDSYTTDLAKDTKIVITYSATITRSAVVTDAEGNVSINPITNEATLQYGNSKTTSTNKTEVDIYNGDITINKYDGDNTSTSLVATFVIMQNDKYLVDGWDTNDASADDWTDDIDEALKVVTTNGTATVSGLACGTYELRETIAPVGYNLMDKNVEFTIEGTTVATLNLTEGVPNYTGTTLPSTGGIGTTIFYVVGGVLVVAAGVLLVTKKRMGE